VVNKQISQAQLLFPKSQYPLLSTYIDLFVKYITQHDICVLESDLEIISIALGKTTRQLFRAVNSKESVPDKLESLICDGLKLKVETKRRLTTSQTELSKEANKDVVDVVISHYQSKLDEIEALKRQVILEQKAKVLSEAKAKAEMLQNQLREEAEAFKASRVDFEDFELYGIKKNSRVDKLLTQLRKKTITLEEFKWLDTVGFSTELVVQKYHLQLAHQHYQNWKQKSLPWELVNASAAYRKAEVLTKIKKALDESYPFNLPKNEKKLKSALLTTYGGVCRDLKDYVNSIKLGLEAHKVTPLNFRPCTLLGAVYLSTGEFDLGHEWYDKAKERGFSQDAYDNDIKSVYFRASDEMKNRLKQNLVATGHSYKWLSESK
jgi:tetratricopeptide (TPR) repeat protein